MARERSLYVKMWWKGFILRRRESRSEWSSDITIQKSSPKPDGI